MSLSVLFFFVPVPVSMSDSIPWYAIGGEADEDASKDPKKIKEEKFAKKWKETLKEF